MANVIELLLETKMAYVDATRNVVLNEHELNTLDSRLAALLCSVTLDRT